ncbi:ImmA/IrrE family metallo-endopeptidase [Streptomyces sp. NPDC058644]|uniref:ImmA/IrrE family metallo-endopeptidase n=1 Tax=unclassified Streptomyces TaxID=2593676 RepID=UPI003664F05B
MNSPFLGRSRRALQAAASLLDELNVDQEKPVDVFQVIEELGLWLVFQPLDALLGAVLPQGNGGIVITTERRSTIQRYTAAHEIGHWELDHNQPVFDTDDDVFRGSGNERERLAQYFASYFLMPPPLVHAVASRHGIRRSETVSPAQAYLAARDMRVSYEAALRQMNNLQVITERQRDTLLQTPPLRAKQDLAYGHRPETGNADVWTLDVRSPRQQIDVLIDDEIVIALPENRSTGYCWLDDNLNAQRAARRAHPAPPPLLAESGTRAPADVQTASTAASGRTERTAGDDSLQVVFDAYEPGWAPVTSRNAPAVRRHLAAADHTEGTPLELSAAEAPVPSTPGVGATGRRWMAWKARAEGTSTVQLHYAAPFEPRTPPAATFTVEATVQPAPHVWHSRHLVRALLDDTDDGSPR